MLNEFSEKSLSTSITISGKTLFRPESEIGSLEVDVPGTSDGLEVIVLVSWCVWLNSGLVVATLDE